MVAVRVKPLVDASRTAMLVGWWFTSPLIEENLVLNTKDGRLLGNLLMLEAEIRSSPRSTPFDLRELPYAVR